VTKLKEMYPNRLDGNPVAIYKERVAILKVCYYKNVGPGRKVLLL
jgi:hypothetical protein